MATSDRDRPRERHPDDQTTTAGFVIGDATNPFYMRVAAGVERVLAREGLTLMIAASDDRSRRESVVVRALLARHIRALFLVPVGEDHSYLEGERERGTAIVAVDRPLANAPSDSVVFDNRRGARAAVQALVDAGHRRIGFVGASESLYTQRERLAGYRDALEANRLPVDPALIRTDGPDVASAEAATEFLLHGSAPTAVFTGNNRASIGALRASRSVGRPLGLLGFDDLDLAEAIGLSVVSHDPQRMGEVAAELALIRMEQPTGPVEQAVLPTRVILRGSERLGL